MKSSRRISVFSELGLLLHEGWLILFGETRNLIISMIFPIGAAAITVWFPAKDMFSLREGTKSACFVLVCAAIWGGLFNSIQVIVKEREIVKRDYVSGALRIECFTISRALIQLTLCLIQSFLLSLTVFGVQLFHDHNMPDSGVLIGFTFLEYWITIFLVTFAADAMGLMISCIVKSEQLASQLSPYILIVQLLFSGVLFEMEGAASAVSALMLSRWGMEGLGSTSHITDLVSKFGALIPITESDQSFFEAESSHILIVWGVLLAFCLVPLIIGDIMLHRVSKDSRG